MSDHPECDKMLAVSEDSQKIGEFLEWLGSQGLHVCSLVTKRPCEYRGRRYACSGGRLYYGEDVSSLGHLLVDESEYESEAIRRCDACRGSGMVDLIQPHFSPVSGTINTLLAKYYGIDMDKVERERRAILEDLRALNA